MTGRLLRQTQIVMAAYRDRVPARIRRDVPGWLALALVIAGIAATGGSRLGWLGILLAVAGGVLFVWHAITGIRRRRSTGVGRRPAVTLITLLFWTGVVVMVIFGGLVAKITFVIAMILLVVGVGLSEEESGSGPAT